MVYDWSRLPKIHSNMTSDQLRELNRSSIDRLTGRRPLGRLTDADADFELARRKRESSKKCELCEATVGDDDGSFCDACRIKYGTVGVIHHHKCKKCGIIYQGMWCDCES